VEALEQRLRSQHEEAELQRGQMRDLRVALNNKDEIIHAREDTVVALERQAAQLSEALETTRLDASSAHNRMVDLDGQLKALREE
jgi:hypothetical protein